MYTHFQERPLGLGPGSKVPVLLQRNASMEEEVMAPSHTVDHVMGRMAALFILNTVKV